MRTQARIAELEGRLRRALDELERPTPVGSPQYPPLCLPAPEEGTPRNDEKQGGGATSPAYETADYSLGGLKEWFEERNNDAIQCQLLLEGPPSATASSPCRGDTAGTLAPCSTLQCSGLAVQMITVDDCHFLVTEQQQSCPKPISSRCSHLQRAVPEASHAPADLAIVSPGLTASPVSSVRSSSNSDADSDSGSDSDNEEDEEDGNSAALVVRRDDLPADERQSPQQQSLKVLLQ